MPPVARALISLCLSAVLALATTSCGDDTQRIEWPAHTAPNSDAEALHPAAAQPPPPPAAPPPPRGGGAPPTSRRFARVASSSPPGRSTARSSDEAWCCCSTTRTPAHSG